jgi:hypothetical protein
MRKQLILGGLLGALLCLPLGLIAGFYFAKVIFGDEAGPTAPFVALVSFAFVSWGFFIGAMLRVQRLDP